MSCYFCLGSGKVINIDTLEAEWLFGCDIRDAIKQGHRFINITCEELGITTKYNGNGVTHISFNGLDFVVYDKKCDYFKADKYRYISEDTFILWSNGILYVYFDGFLNEIELNIEYFNYVEKKNGSLFIHYSYGRYIKLHGDTSDGYPSNFSCSCRRMSIEQAKRILMFR